MIKCSLLKMEEEEIIGRFHKKRFDIQSNYVKF